MITYKKKPTPLEDTNHDPLDVLEELGLLIRRYKGQVETLLASATKQAEINGAVRTLGGLYKQYADISYDLGHPKKISPKYVEPPYDPMREQIRQQIKESEERSAIIEETERKFFEIIDSMTEEEWEEVHLRSATEEAKEAEKNFFRLVELAKNPENDEEKEKEFWRLAKSLENPGEKNGLSH